MLQPRLLSAAGCAVVEDVLSEEAIEEVRSTYEEVAVEASPRSAF